jgi:hypothetical protein
MVSGPRTGYTFQPSELLLGSLPRAGAKPPPETAPAGEEFQRSPVIGLS